MAVHDRGTAWIRLPEAVQKTSPLYKPGERVGRMLVWNSWASLTSRFASASSPIGRRTLLLLVPPGGKAGVKEDSSRYPPRGGSRPEKWQADTFPQNCREVRGSVIVARRRRRVASCSEAVQPHERRILYKKINIFFLSSFFPGHPCASVVVRMMVVTKQVVGVEKGRPSLREATDSAEHLPPGARADLPRRMGDLGVAIRVDSHIERFPLAVKPHLDMQIRIREETRSSLANDGRRMLLSLPPLPSGERGRKKQGR